MGGLEDYSVNKYLLKKKTHWQNQVKISVMDLASNPSFWMGNCHLRWSEKLPFWTILNNLRPFFGHFRQLWTYDNNMITGTTVQKDGQFEILAKSLISVWIYIKILYKIKFTCPMLL